MTFQSFFIHVHLNGAQNGRRKRSLCQNKGVTYNATNVDLGSHYRVLCAAKFDLVLLEGCGEIPSKLLPTQ